MLERAARPGIKHSAIFIQNSAAGKIAPGVFFNAPQADCRKIRQRRFTADKVVVISVECTGFGIVSYTEKSALFVEQLFYPRIVDKFFYSVKEFRVFSAIGRKHVKTRQKIAGVDSRNIRRRKNFERGYIVPIIEIAVPFGQLFYSRNDFSASVEALVKRNDSDFVCADMSNKRIAYVRGRSPPYPPHVSEFLIIIARQIIVFGRKHFGKIRVSFIKYLFQFVVEFGRYVLFPRTRFIHCKVGEKAEYKRRAQHVEK